MTGNRLTVATNAPVAHHTEESLREWCWKNNLRCREANFAHWLYVSKDKETGVLSCKSRVGADAMDIIKLLNGWYPDFKGWDQERLDSEFRILRHMARMGMTEAEWPARSRRVAKATKQLEPA